jgi:hypothetical protein
VRRRDAYRGADARRQILLSLQPERGALSGHGGAFARNSAGEMAMRSRCLIGSITFVAALFGAVVGAPAQDSAKLDLTRFPDWHGQWSRIGDARWDTTKPRLAQQAPLTDEYQAKLAASIADQAAGGHGNDLMYKCIPPGMPRMMLAYYPLEFLFTPDVTYIVLEHMNQRRRIYTDGSGWPRPGRPLRVAADRDPRPQRPPCPRQQRNSPARRRPDHRQGADFHRPGPAGRSA